MKKILKLAVFAVLLFVIFSSTAWVWVSLTQNDKTIFALIVITVSVLTIGALITIAKKKIPVCLVVPVALVTMLIMLILSFSGDPLVLLMGCTIGVITGFSGTIWKWAWRSKDGSNDEGGIPQREKQS